MSQMNDENNEGDNSNLLDQSFKSKITNTQAPRFYNDTSQRDVSQIDIHDDSQSQVDQEFNAVAHEQDGFKDFHE